MYLVYVLRSDNYSYVGMTNNFFRRWQQHNGILSGGAKYTKKGTEWYPICIIDGFETMSEAMQCEWKLKSNRSKISRKFKGDIGRIQYLNLLLKDEKWTSNSPKISEQNLNIYIDNDYKNVMRAGGEILERYNQKRGMFNQDKYSDLKMDDRNQLNGDFS